LKNLPAFAGAFDRSESGACFGEAAFAGVADSLRLVAWVGPA
jgi:hypothetical protein